MGHRRGPWPHGRTRASAPSLLLLALGAACTSSNPASPPPIHASTYDQTCRTSADCIVVVQGDTCAPCVGGPFDSCSGDAAINKSEQARYEADFDELEAQCPSHPPQACPALCALSLAVCNVGACGVCHSPGCDDAGAGDAGSDAALDGAKD